MSRKINDFAARSFRNMADRDYIAARLACRAELMPQFLWSAQQAFEKYLKYILLVNRIPAKNVGHDLEKALSLTENLPFELELRPESREFIGHVATYGEYRYLEVSSYVVGHVLLQLDMAVWDLRRFCQVLDVRGRQLPEDEQMMLNEAKTTVLASTKLPPHKFRLPNGFLEKVIAEKDHPSREALLWQNAFFGVRRRRYVKVRNYLQFENAPLHLYPEMLDELLKYAFFPRDLATAYRSHFSHPSPADPSGRP
jgi:HEPN domain-containing protein